MLLIPQQAEGDVNAPNVPIPAWGTPQAPPIDLGATEGVDEMVFIAGKIVSKNVANT